MLVGRGLSACATRSTGPTPTCRPRTQRFPFVATWDDHEVANNYMGDILPSDDPDAAEPGGIALKTAAYKAWWEHMPTRVPAPRAARSTSSRR
jgi:phosphodiesterase/alkaline phosphatase D-like protein